MWGPVAFAHLAQLVPTALVQTVSFEFSTQLITKYSKMNLLYNNYGMVWINIIYFLRIFGLGLGNKRGKSNKAYRYIDIGTACLCVHDHTLWTIREYHKFFFLNKTWTSKTYIFLMNLNDYWDVKIFYHFSSCIICL